MVRGELLLSLFKDTLIIWGRIFVAFFLIQFLSKLTVLNETCFREYLALVILTFVSYLDKENLTDFIKSSFRGKFIIVTDDVVTLEEQLGKLVTCESLRLPQQSVNFFLIISL